MSQTYGTFQVSKTIANIPRAGACIKIVPFGDIHRESKNCDSDRFKKFLDKCKEEQDDYTYYLGMGDYHDFASWSERKQMRDLHDSTYATMDDMAAFRLETLCEEMSFMKGKLLGLHHGNHEWEFRDGDLATEKMCQELECPFLGYAAHVTLLAKTDRKGHGRDIPITIFSSHGKGGGRLLGAPYTSLEKM